MTPSNSKPTNLPRVKMIYLIGKPTGVLLDTYDAYINGYVQYGVQYAAIRLDNGLLLHDVRREEYDYE